jgi:hypothetical protein
LPITDADIFKTCTKCGLEKSQDNFSLTGKGELRRGDCNGCRSIYHQEYRNREGFKNKARATARKHRYSITEAQYLELFDSQEGVCAICKQPETGVNKDGTRKNLSVDHDHRCCPSEKSSCGQCIRGLLCSGCNRGIGYLKDNIDILLSALSYLQQNSVAEGGN